MTRIYMTVMEVIPAAVVLIPLFLIFHMTVYKQNVQKSILNCLFCLYLAAVFVLVGIPNVTYIRFDLNLNWIPFRGIAADFKNSILNIALFLPLGSFLPVLWRGFRRLLPAALFGLGLSLAIELLQIFTYRATDVNDLITNFFGTVIGYLLSQPFASGSLSAGKGRAGAYMLCALSFGIMFFFHPFLSQMIWGRIL